MWVKGTRPMRVQMCPDLARLIHGWKDSILGGSPTALGPAGALAPPPVSGGPGSAPPPSPAVAPAVPFGPETDTEPPLGDEDEDQEDKDQDEEDDLCLLYTSPSPRD